MNDLDQPHGLLGEMVVLYDVGPIRRRRGHPLLRVVAGPLLVVAAALVGLLVLLPTVMTVVAAVVREGGLLRWSDEVPPAWRLDGFWFAWGRTVVWAAVVPAVVTAVALGLAWRLRQAPGPVLGAVLIAPIAVPLVATGIAFRTLYHPDPNRGLATYAFGWLVGDGGWLGPGSISLALVLAFVWVWLGLVTVVLRSALDKVPPAVEDAVRMAGHRGWPMFREAYWRPVVARVAAVVFVLMAVMSVRVLDLMLVAVPESVLDDARVFAVLHWQTSEGATTGASAALGTLWLAAVGGVLVVALLLRPKWAERSSPALPKDSSTATTGALGRSAGRQWLFVALVALAWIVPLAVLGLLALHDPTDAAVGGWWSWPLGLGSWGELGTLRYWSSFWLTAALTVVVCAAAVTAGGLAVEALGRMSARAARAVVVVMVAAAVVPVQVIAGPVNDVFAQRAGLDLPGATRLGLVHLALAVPVCVVVLYAAGGRPFEILRSTAWGFDPQTGLIRQLPALVGRTWGALRNVGREEPAVVAAFVFVFLQVWNDFVVGLFFSGREAVPLGLLLYGQTRHFVANSGVLAAGSAVMLAVPLALVVFTHSKLVDGLIGVRRLHDAVRR
jgi:alpha-glucoside transport system permease protein